MARVPFVKAPLTTPMQVGAKDLTYPWAQWFKQKWFGGQLQYMEGTHGERATVDPASVAEGSIYYETNRGVWYVARGIYWDYFSGIHSCVQANLPADLGAHDAGFLAEVSDYAHLLQWTGTVWKWGNGGADQSGRYEFRGDTPNPATGWHLCDGSIVNRLNANGALTPVTLPDWTLAVYLKLGNTASLTPSPASGDSESVTATGIVTQTSPVTSGGPSATVPAFVGIGVTPASSGHTHNVAVDPNPVFAGVAHDHGPGTLELRRTQLQAWYRQ